MVPSANKFSLHQVEPGIIENTVLRGSTLEARDAGYLKEANLDLAGHEPYCVLVNIEDLVIITKEWQNITASREYVQKTLAKALLVKNLGQALLASFYLKFNKPAIRTKAFKNKEEALGWLRKCYREYRQNQPGAMVTR
jgi:hypothetical protein